MRLIVLAAISLALLSCGGGSGATTGSATLTGSTIGGQAIVPHDAIAANISFSANGPGHAALIGITSASGVCSMLELGDGHLHVRR